MASRGVAKAASNAAKAAKAAAEAAKLPVEDARSTFLPQKDKSNNLFDILYSYRDWGVGQKLTRRPWSNPDCYWTITKVVPKYNSPLMKRGKAFGILTWQGQEIPRELRIPSSLKREWALINEVTADSASSTSSASAEASTTPNTTSQASS